MAEYPWWAFDVTGELARSWYNVQYTHEEKILLWVCGPRQWVTQNVMTAFKQGSYMYMYSKLLLAPESTK